MSSREEQSRPGRSGSAEAGRQGPNRTDSNRRDSDRQRSDAPGSETSPRRERPEKTGRAPAPGAGLSGGIRPETAPPREAGPEGASPAEDPSKTATSGAEDPWSDTPPDWHDSDEARISDPDAPSETWRARERVRTDAEDPKAEPDADSPATGVRERHGGRSVHKKKNRNL